MNALLKKLNYKGKDAIYLLNIPADLNALVEEWKQEAQVKNKVGTAPVSFVMAFCITQQQVNSAAETILPLAEGDAIIWFCYPKGTSKKYKCEFNRDNGWEALTTRQWESVRMVAIDEDWSALRFRKIQFIKSMKETGASYNQP